MTKSRAIVLGIILCGFLTRFAFLASDSSILLDSGQVGDEGYWLYNARNLALFGKTAQDDFYHDFAAAPLFSFFASISFLVFGTGFWQGRLISAIAGLITILIAYKIGLLFSKKTALLSALLVSVNTLLILHSRLAVGESLQILFINVSLYLYLLRKTALSGAFFAAGILAKTTASMYIPSFVILNAVFFLKGRREFLGVFRFWVTFSGVFLIIFAPILFFFLDKIFLIYSTFGDWLKPQSLTDVFYNTSNFFIHPFWGSPFSFSLAILASVNIINYFTNQTKSENRKLIIYWVLGILILGPLVSRISNARLLPLIVPLAVLSAQTILNREIGKVDLESLLLKVSRKNLLEKLVLFISIILLSFVSSKILLALVKRIFNQELVILYLPHLTLILIPIFFLLSIIFERKIRRLLVLGLVTLLITLPLLAFVRVIADYLVFFRITETFQTSLISFTILVSYVLGFAMFVKLKFDFRDLKYSLILVYFVFNLFGISTILLTPSYSLLNGSRTLGRIAGDSAIIGFYGHELSLENKTTPIYWAPRLDKVNVVNSNFQKYNPRYLLERQSFDLPFLTDVWPTIGDVSEAKRIETIDLSRNFLGARRDFQLILYRIGY